MTSKFNYTPIKRETIEGKRHYCLPDGSKVASVTTILDKTKSQEKIDVLNNWRKRVGPANAQVITTEAAGVGTVMHKMLEEHCLGIPKPPGPNTVQKIAHPMAQQIILNGLVHMNEVWGTEIPLYFPGLYAGTTDGCGIWKSEQTLFDFKQTNKMKKREWIEDYFLQLAAYILAHDKIHNTQIKQGVIFMCSRACEYQEFIIAGDELEHYKNLWWDRVAAYYNMH